MNRKTKPGVYSKRAKAKAIALVEKGYSYAAAGKEIGGASRDTVKRWCDEAGVRSDAANGRTDAGPAPRVARDPVGSSNLDIIMAERPMPLPPVADDSLEAVLRDMQTQLAWTREQAKAAAEDGNNAAASKLNRDAAGMANTIARIKADSAKAAGAGGMVFTAEQLKAARDQLVKMVDRLKASDECRLGVCARCGADLRYARASAPIQTDGQDKT